MDSTSTLVFEEVALFANDSRNRQTLATMEAMLGERFGEGFRAVGIEPRFVVIEDSDGALQLEAPAALAEDIRQMTEKVLALMDMKRREENDTLPGNNQLPAELLMEGDDLRAALHVVAKDKKSAARWQLIRKAIGYDPSGKNVDQLKARLGDLPEKNDSIAWPLVRDLLQGEASGAVKFMLVVRTILLFLAGLMVWLLWRSQMFSSAMWSFVGLGVAVLLGQAGGKRPFGVQGLYRAIVPAREYTESYRSTERASITIRYVIVAVFIVGGAMLFQGHKSERYLTGRMYELGSLVFHDAAGWKSLGSGAKQAFERGVVKSGYSKGRSPGQYANTSAKLDFIMDRRPDVRCEYLLERSGKQAHVAMMRGLPSAEKISGQPKMIPEDADFLGIWEIVFATPGEPVKIKLNSIKFIAIAHQDEDFGRWLSLGRQPVGLSCAAQNNASPAVRAELGALLQSVRLKSEDQ